MEVPIVHVEQAPTREIIRDRRGTVIGTVERQRHVGRLIARDRRGVLVGHYDERSRATRDAYGRLVGRTNLLPALLFQDRR